LKAGGPNGESFNGSSLNWLMAFVGPSLHRAASWSVLRGEREAVEQEAIGVSGERSPGQDDRGSPKAGIDVNATY